MFKVGDKVYSKSFGEGTVDNINADEKYPIICIFPTEKWRKQFTTTGKYWEGGQVDLFHVVTDHISLAESRSIITDISTGELHRW